MMNVNEMEAGPELDALIADKVMGEPKPVYALPWQDAIFISAESEKGNWQWMAFYEDGDIPEWRPRHFSTSIAAAWPVHKTMMANNDLKPIYADNLERAAHISSHWDQDFAVVMVLEILSPLAICRAALKAVLDNDAQAA